MVSAKVLVNSSTNEVRLNPYYAGRWFLLHRIKFSIYFICSLNPYYAGRWFLLAAEDALDLERIES